MINIIHLGDITKINGEEIEPVDVITAKVYMYTFPDGKIYIGMTTKSLEERRDNGYNHNKALKKAMRVHGWRAIEKTILAEFDSVDKAFKEEEKQIRLHNATDPSIGYNISNGGKGTFSGLKHTEEHKEKISTMLKGRIFTEEHIRKMKKSHAKERKPVECYDAKGNFVRCYESLGSAADDIGGHKTNITRACKSGKSYKGFYWKFAKGVM